MKKVDPYRTLSGAMRALDNGGRFYNLFTSAGDQVITAAELKKVAGVLGDQQAAALFFGLATAELADHEQRRLVQALGPKARGLHDKHRPRRLEPARFAADARAGKTYVVEGRVAKFDDVTVTGMIFIPMSTGNITTMIAVPTSDHYTVYEIDGPRRGAECLVLTPKQASPLRGRLRFAGVAKEAEVGKGKKKTKRLRLQARYYSVLGR